MSEPPTTRGHLSPGQGVTVTRLPAPDDVAHLVRQLWVPEWEVPAGERVEQRVLGYPASNVVVEPEGVALHGPTTRASARVLTGRGWAVGALLRPAGALLFTARPAALLDASAPLAAPGLHRAVVESMGGGPDRDPAARRRGAAALLVEHIRARARTVPGNAARDGALANRMVDLVEAATGVRSPEDIARELHVSVRSLQRLAARFVGMPPQLLLRRRRLQEAAERMRAEPATDLGALAAELGFADQSHLSREFRSVLGATPRGYGRSRADQEPSPVRLLGASSAAVSPSAGRRSLAPVASPVRPPGSPAPPARLPPPASGAPGGRCGETDTRNANNCARDPVDPA